MRDFNFRKHGDKLLFALALVVLALVVFRSFDKKITQAAAPRIVFTQWWQNDLGEDTLKALIEEFESLHSGIKIVLNEKSYDDLRLELFNYLSNPAGSDKTAVSPGDVLALDPLWVPELLKKGIVESENVPLLSFVNVLYYNVSILKEAGFSRPPKTRSEFLACARAIAGREADPLGSAQGRAPDSAPVLALGGNSFRGIYDDVYPWMWAAGAQLIKDGKPAVVSRPVVESLSFLESLHSEGLIEADAFSADSKKKLENFVSGRAAFMIASAGDISLVRERIGDDAFGVTSVPVPNYAGKSFFASTVWTIGIHSGSASKEQARLFADFIAGKASFLSDKARAIPVTPVASPPVSGTPTGAEEPSVPHGRGFPLDPFYSKVWDIAIAGEAAQDFSGLAGEQELEEIFREELSALFAGKSSAAGTAAAIQERWQAVLER